MLFFRLTARPMTHLAAFLAASILGTSAFAQDPTVAKEAPATPKAEEAKTGEDGGPPQGTPTTVKSSTRDLGRGPT